MSLLLSLLLAAPGNAVVLTRVPTAPVPVLRGPLAAPPLGSPTLSLGPTLLAAPLLPPSLAPSLIAPQLPAAPKVEEPGVLIDLTKPEPVQSAVATLDQLIGFAKSLSQLGSTDAKPSLDSFWTGLQAKAPAAADGPSYMETARNADFIRLGAITAAAQQSAAGAKVLKSAMALAKKQGAPIQVRFSDLKGNLGEYDYLERVLYLDRRYADGDARLGAATLVHELLHILQHAEGVPSEALEMEMEAHVITLMVLDELGLKPEEESPFSAAAVRELEKSPEAFEKWLARQLPGKLRLSQGLEDVIDDLDTEVEELEEALETAAPSRRAKLERRLASVQADLKRLKTSAGRAAYQKLAARAQALMKRYHRALAQRP